MYDDDYEDDSLDEYPDEADWDDSDEWEEVPCPACGALIAEDSEQCPSCGEYVTFDNNVWRGKPWWWVVLGIFGIVALVVTLALM
ncbi:zinc ribbon domain-containing protein [Aeoliella sp.]|uniref:zinc ribbon domain-containing protein n=1 Tax=Aeoliella sp. TaxID=2795800 RepID=UPI003CCBB671